MLDNINSIYILQWILSNLSEKIKLKIIANNKSLQAKCFIDIIDYKKNANHYVIKDKNGNYKIKSSQNNFMNYEGGYLNGKKNGEGKEYNLVEIKYTEFIKQNNKRFKYLNANMKQEIKNSVNFKNKTFTEESKQGIINKNGEEYFYYIILEYEGEFKNGQRNGKGKEYNKDGDLLFEGEFKEGKYWNGNGKEYNKGRELIFEGEFKEGKYWNGKRKEYGQDGNLVFEGEYKEGERWQGIKKEYYKNGKLKLEVEFFYPNEKGSNPKGKEYDEEGDLIFEGEYYYGKRWKGHGKEYKNNNIIFEGEYKNGQRWKGKGQEFDFEGNLIFEGEYKKGKKIPSTRKIDKDENMNLMDLILECENLLNEGNTDEETKKEKDSCNNDDSYEVEYLKGDSNNRKYKKYNKAGKLIGEGEYINGVKYGKEYDDKRKLIFKGQYSNGQRTNGRGKEFYDNGKLKFDGEYIMGDRKGKKYDINGNVSLINENQNMEQVEKFTESWEGLMNLMMGNIITDPKNSKINNEHQNKDNIKLIPKETRKIYDNNNNFLFEVDNKITSFFKKKEILFDKCDTYKDNNGLTIEFGREINFKKNSIFEGEFLKGEKWNGLLRIYNNLTIEENKNIHFLKSKKNNILIFESDYINGEINGKVKEYNNDGYLIFEGEYLNGVKKGLRTEYNKLGYLIFIGGYLNDKKNGKGKEFDNHGKLIYDGEYVNDKKSGKGKEYDNINKLIFEGEYLDGKKLKGKEYRYNGDVIFEGEYDNQRRWNGKIKEYNTKGNLVFKGEYKNGKRYNGIYVNLIIHSNEKNTKGFSLFEGGYKFWEKYGKELHYDENGKIVLEINYIIGEKNGVGKEYDSKGNIIFKGEYQDGKRNGNGIAFDANKKKLFEGEYINNKKWNGVEFTYKGNCHFEQKYISGEKIEKIIMKEYFKNQITFEGEILNGKKNGKGKEYFKGKLIFEGNYLNGKRNGFGIEYNFKGGKFVGEFKDGVKWDGTGYDENNKIDYGINDGYGVTKEYYNGILIYKGYCLNGKRHGDGKEYDYLTRKLKYKGKFAFGQKLE